MSRNGTFDIDYDDGERERGVAGHLIRAFPSGKTERPSETPTGEDSSETAELLDNLIAKVEGRWAIADEGRNALLQQKDDLVQEASEHLHSLTNSYVVLDQYNPRAAVKRVSLFMLRTVLRLSDTKPRVLCVLREYYILILS